MTSKGPEIFTNELVEFPERLPIASDVPGLTGCSVPEPIKWIFAVGMDLKTEFVLNCKVALLPTVIFPV